jgi:hypothetical protein
MLVVLDEGGAASSAIFNLQPLGSVDIMVHILNQKGAANVPPP